MPNRQEFINAARAYLGVKWRHQSRTKTAVDCAGLIVCALRDIGVEVEDRTDYGRRTAGPQFLIHFQNQTKRKHPDDMRAGDILIFNEPAYPCHCAIATEKNGKLHIIHAHARRRKVVEERYDHEWPQRLVAVLEKPELED